MLTAAKQRTCLHNQLVPIVVTMCTPATRVCSEQVNALRSAHLQKVADKEVWQPALVLPTPHEAVCLHDSSRCRQRERCCQLCCGLRQYSCTAGLVSNMRLQVACSHMQHMQRHHKRQ